MDRSTAGDDDITDLVAVFHDKQALEQAVDELECAGFDSTQICLLASAKAVRDTYDDRYVHVAPSEASGTVETPLFVPASSLGEAEGALIGTLLYVGALAAAGAVVATGGTIAAAVIAAAAYGGAGAAIGSVLATVIDHVAAERVERALAHGGLVLWVSPRSADQVGEAMVVLRRATAPEHFVRFVRRGPQAVELRPDAHPV